MNLVFLDTKTLYIHNDLSIDTFKKYGEVKSYERTGKEEVKERIKDADIIFTNKTIISKEAIDAAVNLKYIGVMATGTNIIEDIEYIISKGITITNVPGYSTNGVCEITFALILEFYKQVYDHNNQVKKGVWENCSDFSFYNNGLFELKGKTLGVIGYGAIAKKVITVALSFDMNVLICTRTPKIEDQTKNKVFVSFNELVAKSDIITIHCPLTDRTKNLFSQQEFENMKNSAILINTARGSIINEKDISYALNKDKIRGFGADVVSKEPIEKDNPLLSAKNCILTPHIAWASNETRQRLIKTIEKNLSSYIDGNPINKVIN